MSHLPDCFGKLLAAWNEPDPARVRILLETALTADVAFTDPHYRIIGIAAFVRMIAEFRAGEGVGRLVPTSGVDMHHDRARYSWAVLRPDGSRFDGFDAVAIDLDQGRISRIDGFFGPLPAVGTAQLA